jgi:hypothetical protein
MMPGGGERQVPLPPGGTAGKLSRTLGYPRRVG